VTVRIYKTTCCWLSNYEKWQNNSSGTFAMKGSLIGITALQHVYPSLFLSFPNIKIRSGRGEKENASIIFASPKNVSFLSEGRRYREGREDKVQKAIKLVQVWNKNSNFWRSSESNNCHHCVSRSDYAPDLIEQCAENILNIWVSCCGFILRCWKVSFFEFGFWELLGKFQNLHNFRFWEFNAVLCKTLWPLLFLFVLGFAKYKNNVNKYICEAVSYFCFFLCLSIKWTVLIFLFREWRSLSKLRSLAVMQLWLAEFVSGLDCFLLGIDLFPHLNLYNGFLGRICERWINGDVCPYCALLDICWILSLAPTFRQVSVTY